jgi:hypothetical protein
VVVLVDWLLGSTTLGLFAVPIEAGSRQEIGTGAGQDPQGAVAVQDAPDDGEGFAEAEVDAAESKASSVPFEFLPVRISGPASLFHILDEWNEESTNACVI